MNFKDSVKPTTSMDINQKHEIHDLREEMVRKTKQ
jgi:hypothetical protein